MPKTASSNFQPAIADRLQQIRHLLRQGKYQETLAACRRALATAPRSAEVYKWMGNAWQGLGDAQQAGNCYARALEFDPNFVEVYANLGSLAATQQHWAAAIRYFQKAISLNPKFAGAYRNLARVWQQVGREVEALDAWYEALRLDPQAVPLVEHRQLAQRFFSRGEWTRAIECWQRLPERDAKLRSIAYRKMGEALQQLGKVREAQMCFQAANGNGAETLAGAQGQETLAAAVRRNGTSIYKEAYRKEDVLLPQADPEALHLLAEAYCDRQQWVKAIRACREALRVRPMAQTYKLLGNALQATGNLSEAERAYGEALRLQPKFAEVYANLGSLYALRRQWEKAIAAFRRALRLEPEFAGAYRNFAKVWEKIGDEARAVECWHRALDIEPEWATAAEHLTLGNRWVKLGDLEKAERCYRRAIDLDGGLVDAWHNLGEVLSRRGEWEAAREAFEMALVRCDRGSTRLSLGRVLVSLEAWEAAIACYGRLAEIDPQQVLAQRNFARLLWEQERQEDSIAVYRQALAFAPDAFELNLDLAEALWELERWEDAIEAAQGAIAVNPEVAMAHYFEGRAQMALEQWEDAEAALGQAVALDSEFFWSRYFWAKTLIMLERWEEAANLLEEAMPLNPEFYWGYFDLGEALMQVERYDEAIVAFRRVEALEPATPWLAKKLGDLLRLRALADAKEAVQWYRQAIEEHSEDLQSYHKALDLKSDDVELYVKLADELARQGQDDGATIFYQIAADLEPKRADISAKIGKELIKKKLAVETKPEFSFVSENYQRWWQKNAPRPADLQQMADTVCALKYQPLISVVMPTYNTPISFLQEAIESAIAQVYPHWELCIADDASNDPEVRQVLNFYAAKDSRIKVCFRVENGHISAASNSALELATGEFVTLLDHDDLLTPDALYEVALLLNRHPEADMIYSDEDKINEKYQLGDPFFKPDWSPDSFLSQMYTCHLGVYRRELIEQIGGFRVCYEGSQDYDLVLRLTEQTSNILHIPKILYHWRIHSASASSNTEAKPYASANARKAIEEAIQRRGEPGKVVENPKFKGIYTVRYKIHDYQKVSIIIPTRNLGQVLDRCLNSIFTKTTYPNYEVILIDNRSDEIEALNVIECWKQKEASRFKCYRLDIPFNYSKLNNYAVEKTEGDYLLFLNNDTEVLVPDWIEGMVEQAQRPTIGAVGAFLLYPDDDTIQHAGVVLGLGGVAGHSHKGFPRCSPGYFKKVRSVSNYSAVTGACLMCRRDLFKQVAGFEEELAVAFNDVDLCLKILKEGYFNVCLPHVVLYHHESKSRGLEDTPEKQNRVGKEIQFMQARWKEIIDRDPHYSIHLTRDREDYSLQV
ncbi:tetratricopeptide repeat protein [Baaleninema simplex]|uniref:tetratricopeptide repeat protein n=1 Tax=Baaleninema simplex TaxID=2862350 RepID=UPI0008FBD76A|nr:tetratricopeptide repeat protein [Baaleninema simplex]